ncbi:MAG: hypothetical protein ACLU30_10595 [Odoribacter splanchnicus]
MNKYLFFILFLFPVHLFAQEADTLIVEAEPHYDTSGTQDGKS